MVDFLEELFATGELVIKPNPADFRRRDIEQTLQQYESVWRTQTPTEPPRFIPDVSARAAKILLIACRAVVFRKMAPEISGRLQTLSAVEERNSAT